MFTHCAQISLCALDLFAYVSIVVLYYMLVILLESLFTLLIVGFYVWHAVVL